MRIAVIGAGLAGLTCAQNLQRVGHHVVVYEKSHAVGGRMSTRQNELGGFDHGAQYFTANSTVFKKALADWVKLDWVGPWKPRLAILDQGKIDEPSIAAQRTSRWVGQPGMRSLAVGLAQPLDIRTGQSVSQLQRYGNEWLLSVRCNTVHISATAGPFDAVIVAIPADQAKTLLSVTPDLAKLAAAAALVPCWTLMLAFPEALGFLYDAAWVSNSRLAWIAQNASKPLRRAGEHWIAQANVAWSIEHLEDDSERVKDKLLKAFQTATGTAAQPVLATAHRWRYAQAMHPLQADYVWDCAMSVGACGDWFSAGLDGAGRVENAFLSGYAMAKRLSGSL